MSLRIQFFIEMRSRRKKLKSVVNIKKDEYRIAKEQGDIGDSSGI